MNQQTDSDANAQAPSGVGQNPIPVIKSLNDARPDWAVDGHGIRGPQQQVVPSAPVTPSPMQFGFDNYRRPGGESQPTGKCNPTTPPTSGTAVWGSVGGVCQWISTTACP